MTNYANAGYRLQHYEITFYRRKDNFPLALHRSFANKNCAEGWALEVLHRNSKYTDFTVEKVK